VGVTNAIPQAALTYGSIFCRAQFMYAMPSTTVMIACGLKIWSQ